MGSSHTSLHAFPIKNVESPVHNIRAQTTHVVFPITSPYALEFFTLYGFKIIINDFLKFNIIDSNGTTRQIKERILGLQT